MEPFGREGRRERKINPPSGEGEEFIWQSHAESEHRLPKVEQKRIEVPSAHVSSSVYIRRLCPPNKSQTASAEHRPRVYQTTRASPGHEPTSEHDDGPVRKPRPSAEPRLCSLGLAEADSDTNNPHEARKTVTRAGSSYQARRSSTSLA